MADGDRTHAGVRAADLAVGSDSARSPDERPPREDGEDGAQTTQIPVAEWVVGGMGMILVAAAVGFMLYRAILGNESPPIITVRVDSIVAIENGYLVTFTVDNSGDTTAAGLTVEGELRTDSEAAETSTVTLDYVPARSSRRGGLFFADDPRQFDLVLQPTGYERP